MGKRLTTEEALQKLNDKFSDKITVVDPNFVYSGVDNYVNFNCSEHGEFTSTFYRLLSKYKGCPKCSKFGPKDWNFKKEKLIKLHGNMYDYSLNDDISTGKGMKLRIICKKHGVFEQTYNDHSSGCGCPVCYKESKEITVNDFLFGAISFHGNAYDYTYVFDDYKNSKSKIRIICKKHGIFVQHANDHRKGVGCPTCKINSHGEKYIHSYFVRNSIDFVSQKTYNDLTGSNGGKLRYDFYIPSKNLLIEYDGSQHDENCMFMNNEMLENTDIIKNEYAKRNKIKLIRIKYDSDCLESELNEIFTSI